MKDYKEWLAARSEGTEEGCREWLLTPNVRGYGKIKVKNKTVLVHRFAYELFKGPIPRGKTIDHPCFNKLCINPNHLEAVTLQENSRRWYEKFKKDNPNFPCGHPRFATDVLVYRNSSYKSGTEKQQRRCNQCWKEYQKEYHKMYKARKVGSDA